MIDYEASRAILERPGIQVIVIKRYDEPDQYSCAVTSWPTVEDGQGWSTMTVIGFLMSHEDFLIDLITHGFAAHGFNDPMPLGDPFSFDGIEGTVEERSFQHYVTHNILPIEWHNAMDELADRVQIYTRSVA